MMKGSRDCIVNSRRDSVHTKVCMRAGNHVGVKTETKTEEEGYKFVIREESTEEEEDKGGRSDKTELEGEKEYT